MLIKADTKNKSAAKRKLFRSIKRTELKLSANASMYISTGLCQNIGQRPYQEDACGFTNVTDSVTVSEKGLFAVLSDGMGGLSNGREVAQYVVDSAVKSFETINPKRSISDQLKAITIYINDGICRQYVSSGQSTAGATMVLVYVFKNRIYWVSCGDSRLYLVRKNGIFQMNEDHDYKNLLYREYLAVGTNLDEIDSEPQKDSLVSFMGKEHMPYADVSVKGFEIKPGDSFVICSDGVYNAIEEETIKSIVLENDAKSAGSKIVETVCGEGCYGQDNMTVMVIKCERKHTVHK